MKNVDIPLNHRHSLYSKLSYELYSQLIHLIGDATRSKIASQLLNDTIREKLNNQSWRLLDVGIQMRIINALNLEDFEKEVAEARKKYNL